MKSPPTPAELKKKVGEEVNLEGWVHDVRVLGGISFVLVRNSRGIVQVAAPRKAVKEDLFKLISTLRQEDVVRVNFRAYPFEIYTDSGVTKALSVILATGANPRRLNLQSEMKLMGRGVSNCAV
jgi:alkyl hydroperoxide reductase subunit AhpF